MSSCLRGIATCVFSLALIAPPALADECLTLDGTLTAEITDDPEFEGLYKYTLVVNWDTGGQALSHLDILFMEFVTCECVCDEVTILFGDPAGTSDGSPNGDPPPSCEVAYDGDWVCMGDPSLPEGMQGPAIKWDAINGDCEPTPAGTGTFCFYTPLAPAGSDMHELIVKYGQNDCTGDLMGQGPGCPCAVPMRVRTWGEVKRDFH